MFSSTSQNLLLILSSNKKEGGRCVLIAVIHTSVKIPACKLYYSSYRDHLSPSLSLVPALSLAFPDSFPLLLLLLVSIITFLISNLIWQPICYPSTLPLVSFIGRLCLKFRHDLWADTADTGREKNPPSPGIALLTSDGAPAPESRSDGAWSGGRACLCRGVGSSSAFGLLLRVAR